MSFLTKLWSGTKIYAGRIWKYAWGHKIISAVVIIIVIGGGYWAYASYVASNATTEYVLATVTKAPLQVTVTGSGQVDANNDLSVTPQGSASGEVTSIDVTAGQTVSAGQTIAQLDDTTAAQNVESAKQDLESAQISYQQTLASSQTSVTSDQTSTQNGLTSAYTDLPTVMNGLQSILYGFSTITGETSEQNIDAYANYIDSAESQIDHAQITQAYSTAVSSYQAAQSAYVSGPVSSLSVQQTDELAQTTIQMLTQVNTVLGDTLTFLNYINAQVQGAKLSAPTQLASQISSLTSYQTTVTNDLTTLQSADQNLEKDAQSSTAGGSTTLNVQSAQLAVAKAQEALDQAETTLDDYTVVAPFSGTIASVPVNQYDQASSGTTIATLITNEEYADLSLNEEDVAKVQVGQPAQLTFDALPNVTINGTVEQINPVGTVTDGVVTYDVRVSFDQQNSQVKPGMSVDATILTASEASAIQVPSSAVTTNGNFSYVKVATLTNASSTLAAANGTSTSAKRYRTASSTGSFAGFAGRTGSTTNANGSFGLTTGTTSSTTPIISIVTERTITVPASEVTIKTVPVTIGLTNDTMTEITSGLTPGEYVVTATQSANEAKSSAASATSLLGGTRTGTFGGGAGLGGGGATFRAGGGGGGGAAGGGAGAGGGAAAGGGGG